MIMNQDSREVVLKGNGCNAVSGSVDKFRNGVDGGDAQGAVEKNVKQSTANQSTTVDVPSTNKAPQIVYLEPHVESMEVTIITGNQENNYNNCYGGQCCRQYDEDECGDEADDFFDDDLDDDFSSPTPCAECNHIDECADERSAAVAADERRAVVADDENATQCSERPASMIPFDHIVKEIANIGQVSLSVAISVMEAYLALCVAFDADVPIMFDKNKFDLRCVGSSNPDWLKRVYRAARRLANDETHLTDKEKWIIDRRDDAAVDVGTCVGPDSVNTSVSSAHASDNHVPSVPTDDPVSIQQFLADMPEPMKGIVECMAQNSKGLKIYRLDVVNEGNGESSDPVANHTTVHNADTIREVKTHE